MGRKTTEVTEPSHQVYHGHILSPLRLTLVPWLRLCLSGFCLWSSSFFPYNTLWKEVAVCNTHLRSEEFCSLPHDGKHLRRLFGILSLRRFVSPSLFIYSIISLYQYGLMDIYFIYLFWVIIACYIIYWVAQFFFFSSFSQWKPIQVGSCIPLICSSFYFFVLFLIFWYYIRCSGLIFPAPALESTISPWTFHSFYWGVGLKIKV